MSVTKLEDIKKISGVEVPLPGWIPEEPFICRLKRVSILDLATKGKIPNPLLGTVIDMFEKKAKIDKPEDMVQMFDVINLFCEVSMVEPTYEEVENIVSLTDEQRMEIYNFAQEGVRKIQPTPEKQSNLRNSKHEQKIQQDTSGDPTHK